MQIITQARAHARALVGAATVGSALTLILGAAYVGGGVARAAEEADSTATPDAGVVKVAIQPANGAFVEQFRRAASERLAGPSLVVAAPPFQGRTQGRDYDCLATAVYYEARGEGLRGQQAVAQVILNRVRHPAFPKTVCGVVFQGCQFSFACDGSMRRGKDTGAWDRARSVASRALAGAVMNEVGSSTHFHARRVAPGWGNLVRVASVGSHVFYRFGGHAGRAFASATRSEPARSIDDTDAQPAPAYTILGPHSRGGLGGLQRVNTSAAQPTAATADFGGSTPDASESAEAPAKAATAAAAAPVSTTAAATTS